MRVEPNDVTAALLIWLSDGTQPSSGDFRRDASLEVFPSFAQAVEHAVAGSCRPEGRLPWIKVGSRVFDPDQVMRAKSTVSDVKGRSPYTA
jgi:hypothetical protein